MAGADADQPATDVPVLDDGIDAHVEWAVREWPEIDPEVEGILTRLCKAQTYVTKSADDTLDRVGLTWAEFRVLKRLMGGPCTHGDLTRDQLVSTGTMTNRLDKLEAAGLVKRLPDPKDRRGVRLQLTDAGRQRLDEYINEQSHRESHLLRRLSPADRRQLNDLLRTVVASLAADLGPPPRRTDHD